MGRLIFVVGNSRSGTTMMGRVLGGHADVFTFNELHFFEQLWAPTTDPETLDTHEARDLLTTLLSYQRDGYYAQHKPWQYLDEAERIVAAIDGPVTPPAVFNAFINHECALNSKPIGCDQTPRNLYYLEELMALYPDARFVVMVRDPRDVLLSQKNRWKRRRLGAKGTPWWNALRTWAGYHPITISMLWRSGVAAGDRFANDPRVCVLRFEDLLAGPEAQLRRVCEALGLSYDPIMLDVPRVGSSHQQDRQSERGLDPGAAGRWRSGGLTKAELAICQRVAGEHMRRHSYPIETAKASPISLLWYRFTWFFKSALALVLNIWRIRSLRESLRRRLGR
jgi:omega-hydroxy-beta-dihydromenaquinone-9 sulfotransferase